MWSGSEQRIESRPRTPSLSPSKLGRHWQEQENALIFTKKHRYGNDTSEPRRYLLSACTLKIVPSSMAITSSSSSSAHESDASSSGNDTGLDAPPTEGDDEWRIALARDEDADLVGCEADEDLAGSGAPAARAAAAAAARLCFWAVCIVCRLGDINGPSGPSGPTNEINQPMISNVPCRADAREYMQTRATIHAHTTYKRSLWSIASTWYGG